MKRSATLATLISALSACGTIDPIPERTDVKEKCRVDGKWLSASPYAPENHAIVGEEAPVALLYGKEQHWALHLRPALSRK